MIQLENLPNIQAMACSLTATFPRQTHPDPQWFTNLGFLLRLVLGRLLHPLSSTWFWLKFVELNNNLITPWESQPAICLIGFLYGKRVSAVFLIVYKGFSSSEPKIHQHGDSTSRATITNFYPWSIFYWAINQSGKHLRKKSMGI